ncbi:MAG TPA: hypothetical protein VFQ45_06820 [Longimicrobium sp.]|nr:hypothetical protein [Longimicrobium sp.]
MGVTDRRLSPGLFGAALLAFFFTFTTYSCMGTPLAKMSGVRMATGGKMDMPKELEQLAAMDTSQESAKKREEQGRIKPNAMAIIALASTVVGLGVSLAKRDRTGAAIAAVSGAVGAASLLVLKMRLEGELQKQLQEAQGASEMPGAIITVDFHLAFWIALLLLAAAAVVNFLAMRRGPEPAYAGAGAGTPPPYTPPPPPPTTSSSYTPPPPPPPPADTPRADDRDDDVTLPASPPPGPPPPDRL